VLVVVALPIERLRPRSAIEWQRPRTRAALAWPAWRRPRRCRRRRWWPPSSAAAAAGTHGVAARSPSSAPLDELHILLLLITRCIQYSVPVLIISTEWSDLNSDSIHTILEDLVLGERRDSLLEVAVADGEQRSLVVEEGHARGQR
jgi:hypothetical protein